jgi:arabinan endo-1,5-alpha-L-arabinosidase
MNFNRSTASLIAAVFLVLMGGCSSHQDKYTGTDTRVHDPVIAQEAGVYYLFGTGDGIAVHSSTDLHHWQPEPPVFAEPPSWTYEVTSDFKGHIWAPDISRHDGRYYLYYSISSGGKNTSAIGVATNETLDRESPDFHWQDQGPVVRSIPNRDLWNAIDANVITDADGTPWMAFGSFWGGLKLVKLAPDRLSLAEPQVWHSIAKRKRSVLVDAREPEPAAIEAPFIFKKNGYYYLFASWDYCCRGVDSTYKIVVGRSKQLQGPYLDKSGKDMAKGGGSLVLSGNDQWPGVGHNSVYSFNGRDYLVFHAYDAADNGRSKLKILEIDWERVAAGGF